MTLLTVFLGVLAWANYDLHRDARHPAVIQAGVWAAAAALFLACGGLLNPIVNQTPLVLAFGSLFFSLGALVHGAGRPVQAAPAPPGRSAWWFRNLVMIVAVIGMPLYAQRGYELASNGPTDIMLMNIRINQSAEEYYSESQAYGPLKYFSIVGIACLLLEFCNDGARYQLARRIGAILLALFYAVLTTGRVYFLIILCIVLGVQWIRNRIRTAQMGVALLGAFAPLFVGMAYILGKGLSSDASFAENLQSMREDLVSYSVASIAAFDGFLDTLHGYGMGERCFRFFFAILERIGYDVHVESLVQDFTYVPMPTNVYTVYQPYYADFGITGVCVAMFLFGWGQRYLYAKALRGEPLYVALYSLSLYPLLMQVFQDCYVGLFSTWLQYLILAWLGCRGLPWLDRLLEPGPAVPQQPAAGTGEA